MDDRMRPGGVVTMILQMSRDSTDFYKGQTTWLVISFLYLSIIYLAEMPWLNRKSDFQCHGNVSRSCLVDCYNTHFSIPVIGVWNTVALTVYSIFFIMEFTVFQNLSKREAYPQPSLEEGPSSTTVCDDSEMKLKEIILNLTKEKLLLSMFLVYYLVQMILQAGFLIILLHYQGPLVKEDIWCQTLHCHGPHLCVFMATQEKSMSIKLMTILSVIIIIFCIIFFLYTISLYALTIVILAERKSKSRQLSRQNGEWK